jgi:hypothetical protein
MAAVLAEKRGNMRDDSKETHAALEAWARWAHSVFKGLGFPAVSIIAKLIELGVRGAAESFGPIPLEIDRTCEIVDEAIQILDPTQKEVIYRTYLVNDAAIVTAAKCDLTYGYYREVLSTARRRVGDYISGRKKAFVFPTNRVIA